MVDERISRAIDNDHTAAMKVTNDGRKVGRKKNGAYFPSNSLFICTFCKKVFKYHHVYRKHLKIHSDKAYVCQICSKSFAHRHYLVNHMTVHNISQVTEYQCHLCSKRFGQKGNLNQHLKFHANKKPFKCNTCGKDFFQQEHLRAHLRHHNNERPFKCEVCTKSFNIKSSLQRHMNCHTGAKPFICDTCQRGYTRRSVLMLHIQQVHENRKPYQCSECHTCFSQKGNLQAHFRRKHLQPKMDNKREHQREKVRRTIRKQTFKQNPKTSKLTPLKIIPIGNIFTHSQISKPSSVSFVPATIETLKREPRIYDNTKPVPQVLVDPQPVVNHESSEKDMSLMTDEETNQLLNKLNASAVENTELYKFLNINGEFFCNSGGSSQETGNANPTQNETIPLGIPEDLKEMSDFDLSSDLKDWEDFFLSDSDILNDYDPDFSQSKFTSSPVKIEPMEEHFSRHPISLCHDYASPLPISNSPAEISANFIPSNCSRTSPFSKNALSNQAKTKLKNGLEAAEKHTNDRKPLEFSVCMEQKIPCMA